MQSLTWDDRAKKVFAQGCNTYSKRSDQYILGISPTHILNQDRGDPAFMAADGVSYCDWVNGLGANILGTSFSHSLPTTLEVQYAERLQAVFPFMERMRFLKTGSAACEAAIRIARAYAGRQEVWGCGYHGASNVFVAAESPGAGCVDEGYQKFGNVGELVAILKETDWNPAAVIVEPVQLDMSVKLSLAELRGETARRGIVLIFDEIISGFRVPKYCFSNYFGIIPDIITLGKAMANGHPLSVVGGKQEIMEGAPWFISNTHNGDTCSIKAAMSVMDSITPESLEEAWRVGGEILAHFNQINPVIQLHGYPTRAELVGSEENKAIYIQEMHRRRHFVGKAWFLNFYHGAAHINMFLHWAGEVINGIAEGMYPLEGPIPVPVFKRN